MKTFIRKTMFLILSAIMLFLFISCNNQDGIKIVLTDDDTNTTDSNNLKVTFLNVGMGDCTFIQYKDTQILIDSGEFEGNSEQGIMNADKITNYIKDSFTGDDKILDYVIVTHSDSDHLGNMGTILDNFDNITYKVGTIIDFDSLYYEAFYLAKYQASEYEKYKDFFDSKCNISYADTSDNNDQVEESYHSDKFSNYKKARDKLIKSSTKYYCVAERMNDSLDYTCVFENDDSVSNITNENTIFKLGEESNSPILRILYNQNYFDLLDSETMAKEIQGSYSDYAYYVNTKSVCVMIEYGESKVLLTGDLEETHNMLGESNLVNNYNNVDEDFLRDVTLYKAAHHGSETSNSATLLKVIKPKYVAISAVANSKGNSSGSYWNFPRQKILENFLSVTDNIYITAYDNDGKPYSYYGNISFLIDDKENVEVSCTSDYVNDYGNIKKLVETDWFIDNRYLPLNTYILDGYESKTNSYLGNCTYIKYGKIDILIDCGVYGTLGKNAINSDCYINKINNYCIDGEFEYVIVTSPFTYSIQQMVDLKENHQVIKKGILSEYKIDNLIDYGITNDPSQGAPVSLYKSYNEKKAELKKNGTKYYSASSVANKPFEITKDLSLNILYNPYYNNVGENQFESAVCSYIEFCDKKLLFMGNVSKEGEKAIVNSSNNDLSNVILFNAVDFGYSGANSKELLNKIKSKELYITINSIANLSLFGEINLTKALCDRLINCSKYCYLNMELDNGNYNEICGDFTFSLIAKRDQIVKTSLTGSKAQPLLQYTNYYKNLK